MSKLDRSSEFGGAGGANRNFADETYRVWAEDYYEREIPPGAVRAIYEHQPLSERLIATLNSELALSEISKDVQEIGYHCEPSS